MKLTKDQVKHVATLARIQLSDAELEKFQQQLGGILDYVDQLNEVNTDGVEPIRQITGLTNMTRPDTAVDSLSEQALAKPDDLLATSSLPKERHQIKVPPVF